MLDRPYKRVFMRPVLPDYTRTMTVSKQKSAETPVQVLRQLASNLSNNATWDDVIRKVTDRRIAAAETEAAKCETDNARFRLAKKAGGVSFFVALTGLIAMDLIFHHKV